jgi:hypothetical protein
MISVRKDFFGAHAYATWPGHLKSGAAAPHSKAQARIMRSK